MPDHDLLDRGATLSKYGITGVALILVWENLVLLGRRKSKWHYGCWSVPGGKVDWGETMAEACIRECKEECGIEPEVVIPFHVTEDVPYVCHWHSCVCFDSSEFDNKEPDKYYEWAWFDYRGLPQPLMPGTAEAIKILIK